MERVIHQTALISRAVFLLFKQTHLIGRFVGIAWWRGLRTQVFLFPNSTQSQHPVLLRRCEVLPVLTLFALAKAAFAQALCVGFAHAFAGVGQVEKFELFHLSARWLFCQEMRDCKHFCGEMAYNLRFQSMVCL